MPNATKSSAWKAHCAAHPVARETLEHFAADACMSAYLHDDRYDVTPTFGRVLKPDGEDAFFAKTIASPETIPRFVTLLRKGLGLGLVENQGCGRPADSIGLVTFGGGDLVGHPGVVHGGVSTAVLDESMSFLLHMYQVRVAGGTPKNPTFTVHLSVDFRAAVPAPGEVVVECWVGKVEGRKYEVRATMKDVTGKILVEAEGLWLSIRAAHL